MTSRKPKGTLRQSLVASWRTVHRFSAARVSFRAAAVAVAAIGAAVAFGVLLPLGESAAWVRLALVLGLSILAVVVAVRRHLRSSIGFEAYLERIEERFPAVRSWLRNALDLEARPPRDTSAELAQALSHETAQRMGDVPLRALRPKIEPRRPALVLLASMILLVGLALLWPARTVRSWQSLWHPALAAAPVRLAVEPGSVRITPGAALAVRARVWGSARRPELQRSNDRSPAAAFEGAGPGGERLWRFDLTQLTRDQDYRVRVAAVQSPRYHISLAGEPLPVSFQIEYRSPAYARLPVQRGAATRGDLSALRGTRAAVEVTFDRDLEDLSVRLPGGATSRWTQVTARRWKGEIALEREGEYELAARASSGAARYRYRLSPLADAPPLISVRVPSGDLDLPTGQQIPLAVLGQDDLGLSELRLQYHKDVASPWVDLGLARFKDRPREASVESHWDATTLGLLPGQTATFRFALYDDNAVSGRGVSFSPTFQLRFPSLADLYEHIDETQNGVQNTMEKVAEQARELQKSLDKLSRQPQRSSPQGTQSFERSEEMKTALERQQQMNAKLDEASKQLKQTLEQAAERQAFNQQLTRKLQEMAQVMEQIQSPEFRDALKRMQQALENMDKQALEQNLPQWRQENKQMLENLDRTIELLKQLREEEKLQAMARRAEELKKKQDALNREHESRENSQRNDPSAEQSLAKEQEKAASETEKLSQEARALSREMDRKDPKEKIEKAADEMEKNAAPDQHQASKSASQGQRSKSSPMGKKASESLERASEQLSSLSQSLQQEREGVDVAAVRRAAQDLVSLQREAESNLASGATVPERADRQTDLSEGVSRVADSLSTLSKRSPFISPKLNESLGRAISGLSNSGKELGSGNRSRGEDSGRGATSALNEAVLELRRTESSMCQNPGPSGDPKRPGSMTQRVGELGEKQSQLNQETRSLAQRLSEQMRLSAGDRGQLQRLSEQQHRLREQLEQIQRDEEARRELLGKLEGAKRDMQEAEEILQNGDHMGDVEERQQRILSRLLDAQRSVNRRDFEPQRESRPGEEIARRSAPELPAELFKETDRLRLDLLKAEADRYPAQYRSFVEAYLRRLNGSRR